MYRPPENSNRVKSIKSKFENVEPKDFNMRKNGTRSDLNKNKNNDITVKGCAKNLSRQLSDPAKRNIKRTPAFRIDVSAEKNNLFQRNTLYNRSFYLDKIQKFNSALKNNCDDNRNIINNKTANVPTNLCDNEIEEQKNRDILKPPLIKSKSSHDFALIRSKFDRNAEENEINCRKNVTSQRNKDSIPNHVKKMFPVYTEPVPKALRNQNLTSLESDNSNDADDIYNSETIRICDFEAISNIKENEITSGEGLTDTLKAALKRPLPKGPAPQKPPRTFEHTPVKDIDQVSKNTSFLHQHSKKQEGKKRNIGTESKHDARYMLNKLENALRNNKIHTRKQSKLEASTTSGDDSDDSVLFKSKTDKRLPSIPNLPANSQSSFNFNCLNGLTTCNTTYETVKESNSSFFVSCQVDEPVYAEPFNFSQDSHQPEPCLNPKNDEKCEKSLYYMSTSLLCEDQNNCSLSMDETIKPRGFSGTLPTLTYASHKQLSSENSSHSSVTSDLDSAASTPIDENESIETSIKIKQLINTFETKQPSNVTKINDRHYGSSDGAVRIEELKMSLQKTLERHFDQDTFRNPVEELNQKEGKSSVDKIIDKFQKYVKTMPKYQKPKLSKNDRLFYCCLVVGWDSQKPQIKFKFPSNVKLPDRIEDLCYPEVASGPLDISDNAQCYSLVITNDKGERTFGYCRRVIPEGSNRCIPLAYCILSKYRAPRFYKKILTELESRHGIPDKLRDELISKFYYNKFPRPGESIKIDMPKCISDVNVPKNEDLRHENMDLSLDLGSFVHINLSGYGTVKEIKKSSACHETIICESEPLPTVENNETAVITLTLHHDTRYEEADLKPLHRLPSHILLKIFASLLLERKVILISCVISKLSCCVDALQSILYPFSWPHTFIPILPQCLWDVVEAPTPVICGILSVSVINNHKIEHGIVVDLDEGSILSEEGDEDSILSDSMKKAWYQGLTLANSVPPEDYVHSVYLSDAYIKVFIVSLKHYKNYINDNTFEKDAFIRSAKTKCIRRFLKWFTETTMFVAFVDSVISNPENYSLFDQKIEMYGSEGSDLIVTKLLGWKK